MADLGLADAVDAAEALLEPVRVPGQVVVDHQVGALQVDAFASRIGRQQDLDLGVVFERLLGFQAVLTADAPVDDLHGVGAPEPVRDLLAQVVQGVAVLGEDHQLLRGRRHRSRWRRRAVDGLGLLGRGCGSRVAEDLIDQAGELVPLLVGAAAADLRGQ